HRRTRRITRAAVATLAGLTVVSAGAAYVALQQKNLADERLVISEEARRDAEIARNDAEEQRAVAVEARDNEAAARRAAEAAEEQERQARVTAEARLLAAEATQALYEEDGLITRAALLSVASLRAAPNDRAAEVARIVLARLGEPIGITGDVPDDHRLAGLRDQVEANMKTAERSPAFSVDFETWTASLKIFGQDAGEISSQQFWEPISCQEAPSWMKVTTSASNTALRVTDTRSGRFRVVVHDGWIVACKVLNRGELLVTASGEVARELPPVPLPGDGTLVVWDLRKSLFSYGASFSGTESVVATDFSADGRFATLSELRGDEVPIFDLKTGKRIVGLVPSHPGSVTGLAFSPDGTHLAVAPIYEEEYDLFSGEAFSERKVLAGQHGEGNVHFSPDGTYLVTDYGGLSGGGADLWRTDDVSSAVQSFTGNSNVDLLFLSDGTGFVELGYDGAVLWRIGDQEPALQFGGPGSDTGLISSDNSVVALSDQGGGISLWPLSAKQASRRIGEGDWVRPHAFSPDGSLLVLSEDSRLVVRAVSDGKVMYSRDYGESIGAATFSQSGRFLAVSTYGYGGQEITGLNASTVLDIFETETWTRVARLNPRGLVREL
ncbi:MAG: WD40 repeat domain-containing protein, partial [Pseudomonadota bacterium]